MEDKLISIESDLFILRMIFLLETEPQSNKYEQLLLTEEYHKVNIFIKSLMPKCSHAHHAKANCIMLNLEDKYTIKLPSEIREFHTEEYINS